MRLQPASAAAWRRSEAVEQDLRPFLTWLLDRHAAQGGVTELRVIPRGGRGVLTAIVGPEDLDGIPDQLAAHVGVSNVYFGLNPVRPDRHPRHPLQPARQAVRDADVLAYSLLAIDIDPERHPRDRSASDAEKADALEVAEAVRGWLADRGARPVLADSGNGYHLLVPLVPAYDDELVQTAQDVRTLLRLLDQRFSTPGAHVDLCTFNPSRVLKLYGTIAVKGVSTPEHPHRLSTVDLSHIPDDLDLFARLREEEESRPLVPPARREREARPEWRAWRREALAALPLEAVYGPWLTGLERNGWRECRDPWSDTGDRNPSAGVADGSGTAERASFHSFRTGETVSVFDFLLRRGEASDFREAAARIAELSGVPTPGGERSEPEVTFPERFARAWTRARSDEQRNGVVRKALEVALTLPALEQSQALDVIRQHSGLSLSVLRRTLAELRRDRRTHQVEDDDEPGERPVIDYVTNQDRIDTVFDKLLDAVAPAERFFRQDEDLVFVHDGVGPRRVTERNVVGLVSALAELRLMQVVDDELRVVRYDVLPGDLARAFVHSPGVHEQLPELGLYTRSPLFDRAWRFVGEPGFQPDSGVYYDGPTVEPAEGTELLEQALSEFHFKEPADRVNFLAAALTALTMPHWGRGHPFVAINGNKPGVGKSTLARLLGVLAEGREPSSISWLPDDNEFEKQIATRVEAGDRVVVIDNAKTRKPIESAVLERCITDTRLNFRRLGSNTAISRPQNDMLFCLTMNLTQMGADLRRRALPVNLELSDNTRDVAYALADVVGWAIEHRLGLLAELAGMVQRWVAAGRPLPEDAARHSTSQAWAETMDGILRLSGFDGLLSNFEATEHAFDPRYQVMQEVAEAEHGRPPASASAWAKWLQPWLGDRFVDRNGRERSERARATIVGALFRDYLDARFEVDGRPWRLVREYPDGPTRSPVYRFAPADSRSA